MWFSLFRESNIVKRVSFLLLYFIQLIYARENVLVKLISWEIIYRQLHMGAFTGKQRTRGQDEAGKRANCRRALHGIQYKRLHHRGRQGTHQFLLLVLAVACRIFPSHGIEWNCNIFSANGTFERSTDCTLSNEVAVSGDLAVTGKEMVYSTLTAAIGKRHFKIESGRFDERPDLEWQRDLLTTCVIISGSDYATSCNPFLIKCWRRLSCTSSFY